MAMPASGCIGIITCPNAVACTSISQAVDGNVTPPKSLSTLSTTAGKTAPHAMTEFYGYASAAKVVNICQISKVGTDGGLISCSCSCLYSTPSMSVGDCYDLTFCWTITKSSGLNTIACYAILCNSVSVYTCTVSGKLIYNCTGSVGPLNIKQGDAINIINYACVSDTVLEAADSYVSLTTISNVVGNYSKGTTCTLIYRYAGVAV